MVQGVHLTDIPRHQHEVHWIHAAHTAATKQVNGRWKGIATKKILDTFQGSTVLARMEGYMDATESRLRGYNMGFS
jgi:hypothetical protein